MTPKGTVSDKLSSDQRRAILALISTKSVAEAAKQSKVGQRTLWRWLGNPDFKGELVAAEGELIDSATRRLLQLQAGAIDTVETLMNDQLVRHSVRLRAAQTVLDHLLKLRELRNVEARLAALEAAVNERQGT